VKNNRTKIKSPFNRKIKGGALQYTIFIAVVIALLVFAFIALTYTQQHFKSKAIHFLQVIHNTNLAINYASTTSIKYDETVELQFSDTFKDKTTIMQKHWGLFDMLKTSSTLQKETFTKNALLGGFLQDRPSLYVQENNQPLVLVGDSRIEGITFLPKQGIKRGTIAGNSFTGSQLIYGSIGLSNTKLPEIKNREYLKRLTQGKIQFNNTVPLELNENTKFINSFNSPTQYFYSNTNINLQNIQLTGNIVIQSTSLIKIYPSALLTDIILIAPKIEISQNVTGNFQAFASKEIHVKKNCKLGFPTALFVYKKKKNTTSLPQPNPDPITNLIEIQTGAIINGIVGFLTDNQTNNFKPQILQENDSTIKGEVYCNGNFELKGTVMGSVFTKGFIASQFGSIYQNHIYNGNILSTGFPKEYCGLTLKKSTKKVSKWLYY